MNFLVINFELGLILCLLLYGEIIYLIKVNLGVIFMMVNDWYFDNLVCIFDDFFYKLVFGFGII